MESNYDATSYEGVFPCSVSIIDITEVETAQFDSRSITSTVWNDSSSDSLPVQKPEIPIPAASSSFGMEQSTAPVKIESVDTCIGMSQEYLHKDVCNCVESVYTTEQSVD